VIPKLPSLILGGEGTDFPEAAEQNAGNAAAAAQPFKNSLRADLPKEVLLMASPFSAESYENPAQIAIQACLVQLHSGLPL